MSDIRAIVREILLEELARHGGGAQARRETVSIRNDRDLNAFALRVLELAGKGDVAGQIRSGQLRFELGTAPSPGRPPAQGGVPAAASTFDKGLVTEKHIAALDRAASISVGKGVCFTPLAKDEMRRKGIKVVRKNQ